MLLANLLRTLSEEELQKIRKDFRLPERSYLIFERIAASSSSPPTVQVLTKVFRITKANFYSICSEIIDECVRILAPKEEFSTMKFFHSKYLYRPFVTEARRAEKFFLHEKDLKTLERFYAYVFINMRAFPADIIDVDLLYEYGNKWHKVKENPPPDDDLYILLRGIFIRIAGIQGRKKMNVEQISQLTRSLLNPVANRANSSPNPLVRYEYYQAEWITCEYIRTDRKAQIKWLDRSLDVVRKNPDKFDKDLAESLEVRIAYGTAMNFDGVEESLNVFLKYYKGKTPDTPRGWSYFAYFIKVALLARNFEIAKKILEDLEGYHIVQVTPALQTTSLLLKTMLEINRGYLDSAAGAIENVKALNRENFFLSSEIDIRGLETTIALKRKDFAFAEQLVDRNIKWLRSRRISLSVTSWIYYYQMIDAIIKSRLAGEPIRASLLDHFKNDFRAEYPDFFLLLESELP